jgi:hypothetical protein
MTPLSGARYPKGGLAVLILLTWATVLGVGRQQRGPLSYRRPRREENGKMGTPGDNPQSRAGAVELVLPGTSLGRMLSDYRSASRLAVL